MVADALSLDALERENIPFIQVNHNFCNHLHLRLIVQQLKQT